MKKLIALVAGLCFVTSISAGECTVKVIYPDGSARSSVKVSACINSGGFTKDVLTNSAGEATLTWSGDRDVQNIYVAGVKHEGCDNGDYVTLTK